MLYKTKKIIKVLILVLSLAIIILIAKFFWLDKKSEIQKQINNFSDCAAAGYPIMESYPRQCKIPFGQNFTEDIGNELDKNNLIRVIEPRPNNVVKSPLVILGVARGSWFFEASFPVKLIDNNGAVLTTGIATAIGDWMTADFVNFKIELNFSVSATTSAELVLQKDNPSGLKEYDDELRLPLTLMPTAKETMKIKLNFFNEELGASIDFNCTDTAVIEREIEKTSAPARAAIEELLKGPILSEIDLGFSTTIPADVKLQKITIENNIAKVDFDETLERGVGGSCRVAAIRSQITQTLKQFSNVKEVIISINGRTEDILQP